MPTSPRQWNSTLPRRKKPMDRGKLPRASFSAPGRDKPKPCKPFSTLGKKKGKRTRKWDSVRAALKPRFERAGITTCELRCGGCANNNFLGFAHSLKRADIKTDAQWEEVILACNNCHDIIEKKPHAEMYEIVCLVILTRPTPVERIFD